MHVVLCGHDKERDDAHDDDDNDEDYHDDDTSIVMISF